MKPLTTEFLDVAAERFHTAGTIADDDPATAPSTAAYYAARAALPEHEIAVRSHRGTWHEFRNRFVLLGHIDAEL